METEIGLKTVGEMVRELPRLAGLFEQLGIDYCCGGDKSLAEACDDQQISLDKVYEAMLVAETDRSDADEPDWSSAPLGRLIDHIIEKHHTYLRDAFPQLDARMKKVLAAHVENHSELVEISQLFTSLQEELMLHMQKEELMLFPWIKAMENQGQVQGNACGSVRNPIDAMESEHEFAGTVLKRLSELTKQYTPPEGACNTFHALYDGMASFERDLHLHIHKENNILFPRAAELEDSLAMEISEKPCQ